MEKTTSVVLVAILLGWVLLVLWKKGIANFWRLLAETNERYGTSFGKSPEDKATVVGVNLREGGALAFDQASRKIAYLTRGGKSIEVLGYEFVQSWRVTWREKTSGNGAQFGIVTVGSAHTTQDKVFLEITTNDIKRPVIKMPMSSVRYAEETAARLKILINAKN
ncbi:hypothetical protein GJ697_09820 [Pseudoduganella sp. FT25W]|uniref:Uncharacterized protein n=1 Tax=Duganella alba TaxID=2666081 RepID=A0A6L5QEP1_9BURK|nr:hypothetical protein [Duganella alba]MRX08129.1 hypothetical protein [Duganella alba]MRX16334.1 hypothetical protein [Duganella alba]